MKKLTEQQYRDLQSQYDRLPDRSITFFFSGEHQILTAMLNKLGYHPMSTDEVISVAERLLSNGYK